MTGEDVTQEELGGAQGALPQVGRRRPRGGGRRGVHRRRSRHYLSFFPRQLRGAAAARARPPTRSTACSEKLLDILPESNRKPYDMYEVIRRDRRRRRVLRHQAAVREDDHHLPRALRRPAGRDRRQPAEAARRHPRQRLGRQGGALRQPLRRLRHPARLPAGRARASWSARRSSTPGSSATARRCSTRSPRDGAEDHRRHPQGLRRRLLRDERPRLRARPDRRLAERRDLA